MNEKEYCVNQALPNNGQKVLYYGYHTYCCKEDMDEQPAWHEATFQFIVGEYRLKKEIPTDPEKSILEYCYASEHWSSGPEFTDGFVIGVTKWKKIK